MVRLQIELLGEILLVRGNNSKARSDLYPGQVFRTEGVPFTYDELRGMGNGTHEVKNKKTVGKSGR